MAPLASAGGSSIAAIAWLLVTGLAATAFSVPLNHLSPVFAIAVHALVALAIMVRRPGYAPIIAIFVLLFQNVFVSIFSPEISDKNELNFVRGYNFLVCTVLWLVAYAEYFLGRETFDPAVRRIMRATNWTVAFVGIYFLYGLVQEGSAAIIYLRNIMLPIFLFQLALLTSSRSPERITPLLVAIGILLFACGYFELLFREGWFNLTNSETYWGFAVADGINSGQFEREMRQTGQVFRDYRDMFRVDAFNTPLLEGYGLEQILRLNGPNMSTIAFGYAIAFFALFLMASGYALLGCLAIPILIFISAKGPIIVMLFVIAGWVGTRLVGPRPTLVLGIIGLVAYALLAIWIGLNGGDYHVIGFMGGVNGFLSMPWGRGIGIGGNLATDFSKIDWSAAQGAGATEGAVESAVGVLLYQMGVAAAVPLGLFVWIGLSVWKYYARSGIAMQGLAAFGTLTIVVNGIFQEEALFSPPALGFMLCLAGLCLGRAIQADATQR